MIEWIKILYSNQAIVDKRRLSIFIIPFIFLFVVFLTSIPYANSLFQTNIIKDENLISDFESLLKAYPTCRITDGLVCDEPFEYKGNSYNFIYPTTDASVSNLSTVMLGVEDMAIIDQDNTVVLYGYYPTNLNQTFAELSTNLLSSKEGITYFFQIVGLSVFYQQWLFQYFMLLIQTLIYVMVIGFLLRFISTQKPRKISFIESATMVVMLLISPALLAASIGLLLPSLSSLIFTGLLVIRVMVLYQNLLKKKLIL